jgi:hypothetical protein
MSILQSMFRPGPARRLHLTRVKALLLFGVFLSAGTSLPSIDALAYHQGTAGSGPSQSHVEPAGGCLDHAGHCGLGRTAPGTSADVPSPSEATVEPDSRPAFPVTAQPLRSADPNGLPNSRAPPVFLA